MLANLSEVEGMSLDALRAEVDWALKVSTSTLRCCDGNSPIDVL